MVLSPCRRVVVGVAVLTVLSAAFMPDANATPMPKHVRIQQIWQDGI
jgi:hypothetical protein